jgi:uncharacterized protein YdaU (DUF1376 family)
MAKDPAFLFYPGDWLGGTLGMSLEEKGAYLEILILQFNRGHMTSHIIGQVIGQLWGQIKHKFIQDEGGLWFNERLDIEKKNRETFTASRKNNLKGNNQYTKKTGHKDGHMTSHMEDEDINENESINKGENEKLLIPKMFSIFKTHLPNYPGSKEKDFKHLLSIANFILEQSGNTGPPTKFVNEITEAWEPICLVIKKDNFYSQKSLSTISNHIQEILQNSLHGKPTTEKLGTSAARIEKARNW